MWYQGLLARKVAKLGDWLADRDWSDAAVDRAYKKIDKIGNWLEKVGGTRGDRDDTPLSMSLDGGADAIGTDTVARAELDARITDHGSISLGRGHASFFAAAEGERPYASTFAYSEVSGADFVLSIDRTITGTNWEHTHHHVLAIDFAGFEMRHPRVFEFDRDISSRRSFDVEAGNVATAEFVADVAAEDSYLDIYADALAIEDAFSGSSIEATLAIG